MLGSRSYYCVYYGPTCAARSRDWCRVSGTNMASSGCPSALAGPRSECQNSARFHKLPFRVVTLLPLHCLSHQTETQLFLTVRRRYISSTEKLELCGAVGKKAKLRQMPFDVRRERKPLILQAQQLQLHLVHRFESVGPRNSRYTFVYLRSPRYPKKKMKLQARGFAAYTELPQFLQCVLVGFDDCVKGARNKNTRA
ncbi:hypothetical protein BaRGS_00025543, partial [Batillaria attramentaria]